MSPRDRSILSVVAVLIVAIGGFLLLVQPKHHQVNQVLGKIAAAQSQLAQSEASAQAGRTAESQFETYGRQLNAIKRAVPSDDQIPELINQLQAVSHRNHVSFQTVSVSTAAAASTGAAVATTTAGATTSTQFPSQDFNLSFTGGYFAVARTLGELAGFVRADDTHLHATGRLLNISTVSMTPAAAGPGSVTALVAAVDYDVPTSLVSASSSTSTSTASPAAYVTP